MTNNQELKDASFDELKSAYGFGTDMVRGLIDRNESVSPWVVLRLLEITDEIVSRYNKEGVQNGEKQSSAVAV
jgi:hypothetical protein